MKNALLWLVFVIWTKHAKLKIDVARLQQRLSRPGQPLAKESQRFPKEGTLAPLAPPTKRRGALAPSCPPLWRPCSQVNFGEPSELRDSLLNSRKHQIQYI